LDYIKKVEKVYLMVTGLAKWLRERRKKERVEKTKRKKAI
jgi:3-mercaptopyruvate sulfurtransferase SseA